jgi:hypothetical protein
MISYSSQAGCQNKNSFDLDEEQQRFLQGRYTVPQYAKKKKMKDIELSFY